MKARRRIAFLGGAHFRDVTRAGRDQSFVSFAAVSRIWRGGSLPGRHGAGSGLARITNNPRNGAPRIIAANAPLGIRATKAAGRKAIETVEHAAIGAIVDTRAHLLDSKDAAEAIEFFVERRGIRISRPIRKVPVLPATDAAIMLGQRLAVCAKTWNAAHGTAQSAFAGSLGSCGAGLYARAFPIVTLLQILSAGAMGGTIWGAIGCALGAGGFDASRGFASAALLVAVGLGQSLAAMVRGFGAVILQALGGSSAVLDQALAHSVIAAFAIPGIWLANTLPSILRGSGNLLVPAATLLIAGLAQVAVGGSVGFGIGPLPRLGIAGVAMAQVAAFWIATFLLMGYLSSRRYMVGFGMDIGEVKPAHGVGCHAVPPVPGRAGDGVDPAGRQIRGGGAGRLRHRRAAGIFVAPDCLFNRCSFGADGRNGFGLGQSGPRTDHRLALRRSCLCCAARTVGRSVHRCCVWRGGVLCPCRDCGIRLGLLWAWSLPRFRIASSVEGALRNPYLGRVFLDHRRRGRSRHGFWCFSARSPRPLGNRNDRDGGQHCGSCNACQVAMRVSRYFRAEQFQPPPLRGFGQLGAPSANEAGLRRLMGKPR